VDVLLWLVIGAAAAADVLQLRMCSQAAAKRLGLSAAAQRLGLPGSREAAGSHVQQLRMCCSCVCGGAALYEAAGGAAASVWGWWCGCRLAVDWGESIEWVD